jgi:3-methyladenine DNA glycosylase AlkD
MKADLIAELEREIQPDKIDSFSKYFGIAPGKYGEGDIYLAINTTKLRKICKKYKKLPREELIELLDSPVHDYRFAGLVILRELNSHKDNFWHRRISLVAYLYFYRKKVLGDGMELIDASLDDESPLVQKACGWMLRNIYNKIDKHLVESYIIDNYARIPRSALRAAIDSMPEEQRLQFLHGEF